MSEKAIIGALRSAIEAHGPITKELVGSAAKRVAGAIDTMPDPFVGELAIYRKGEWLMGINEPFIEPVLAAIRAALPEGFCADDDDGA